VAITAVGQGQPSTADAAPLRAVALLDVDPDLGADLRRDQLTQARAELRAHVVALPRGEWAGNELAAVSPRTVGLLVLRGVIAREVVLEDTVSTELLGPGELVRPWGGRDEPELLEQQIRWQVLAEARLAVLGPAFAARLARFPEIAAVLIDRASTHAQQLATLRAVGHLNSVDRRLLALFWHLAGRWGRITPDGVVVPLELSHRLLGELVGARRQTVSTALSGLQRDGKLLRRSDATWLLVGEPPGRPKDAVRRVIAHRRRLLAHEVSSTSCAR